MPKDAWEQDVQLIILNLEKAARDYSEGKGFKGMEPGDSMKVEPEAQTVLI